MHYRPAAAAVALLLLLAAAGPAHAANLAELAAKMKTRPSTLTREGTGFVGVKFGQEQAFKQLLQGMVAAATPGAKPPPQGVAAAAAPANMSAADVLPMMAAIMVAAVEDRATRGVLRTLGDPKVFPYPDGSGRVALYRMPKGKAKGTCIFVHGCKHDPFSWFYKSPRCPMCTGLPEEVSHSKQCLARGYAVLALMSLNREYKWRCFSSSGEANDHPSAAQLVQAWTRKLKMNKKPLYIWGISSGASFAIKFPGTMKVQGVVSEVNMPWEKSWGATNGKGVLKYPFPPTVFYMMKRDLQTKMQIEKAVDILRKNKVNSDYVYVDTRLVTPDWLSMRSMYISPEQSAQLQKALIRIKVLDKNGEVRFDVRIKRNWVKALPKFVPWLDRNSPYYNLISDESQIWQELNLAWAWHEIVSDYVRATLAWLETKGKANLAKLVAEYDLKQHISCLTEWKEGC